MDSHFSSLWIGRSGHGQVLRRVEASQRRSEERRWTRKLPWARRTDSPLQPKLSHSLHQPTSRLANRPNDQPTAFKGAFLVVIPYVGCLGNAGLAMCLCLAGILLYVLFLALLTLPHIGEGFRDNRQIGHRTFF